MWCFIFFFFDKGLSVVYAKVMKAGNVQYVIVGKAA